MQTRNPTTRQRAMVLLAISAMIWTGCEFYPPAVSSPVPSPTPVATGSPLPTASTTASPGPTPTSSPTASPTPTPTPVPASTATPTTSPASPSPTPTASPTPSPTPVPTPSPEAVASITYSSDQQIIDGFGTSTAWGSVPNDANLDNFFSITKGAGLSILRNRIPFRENATYDDKFMAKVPASGVYERNADYTYTANADGSKTFNLQWSNWDLNTTRNLITKIKAKGSDYQVDKIFSTPWTPPNNSVSQWKVASTPTNTMVDIANAPERGGTLAAAHYADYADVLADYANGFAAYMGMPLYALSLQNEPSYVCTYESADWTATQFHDFVAVLQAEFTKKSVSASLKVIAPEDPNYKETLIVPTLTDAATAARIDIVGAHQYEVSTSNALTYTPSGFANTRAGGKKIWMTEWSTSIYKDGSGQELTTIDPALILARIIHLDLSVTNANAFIYWWTKLLLDGRDGSGNLNNTGNPTKQLGVLGQFSRVLRPGWYRVSSTTDPLGTGKVLVTVYRDSASSKIAVVAINLDNSDHRIGFGLAGGKKFGSIAGYRTSAAETMADLDSGLSSTEGSSTLNRVLLARSVSTWYGTIQ